MGEECPLTRRCAATSPHGERLRREEIAREGKGLTNL